MHIDPSGESFIFALAIVGFAFLTGGSLNILMQKITDPNAEIDWREALAVATASGISAIPLFGTHLLITQLVWTASTGAMGGLSYAMISANVDIANPGEVVKSMAIGAASNLVAFAVNKGLQNVGVLPKTSTTIANDNLGFDFVVETATEVLRTPLNTPASFGNYIIYGSGKEIVIGVSFNIFNDLYN